MVVEVLALTMSVVTPTTWCHPLTERVNVVVNPKVEIACCDVVVVVVVDAVWLALKPEV